VFCYGTGAGTRQDVDEKVEEAWSILLIPYSYELSRLPIDVGLVGPTDEYWADGRSTGGIRSTVRSTVVVGIAVARFTNCLAVQ